MTVDDYFKSIPLERAEHLQVLKKIIVKVFPNVVEDMTYNLPTFTYNNFKMCAIANQKNYMALYIMNYDLLVHFKEELKDFNCGKSCIRFKKLDEKSIYLFEKILFFLKENIKNSHFYKS